MNRFLGLLVLLWAICCSAQDSVTTIAGQPLVKGASNGLPAQALFNDPAALVADAAGNLFIADSQNHVIRRIDRNGLVTTFAGRAGTPGSNNGSGSQARFSLPNGIAHSPNGDFYVSDTGNHTIRKITRTGAVTTIAGVAGESGSLDGAKTTVRFNSPLGLAVAVDGTIFVADTGNHLIRSVTPDGVVTTLVGRAETWGCDDGTGSGALFNGPVGVALDSHGDLFVSDSNNHTVRKITRGGVVSTWAGVPEVDGFADDNRLRATFSQPAELAFDRHGNLFVADSLNHVIRQISLSGKVSTVTGRAGVDGAADGSNGAARLFNPYGLTIFPDGSLVVSDAYNQLLRAVLVPFRVGILASGSDVSLSWNAVIGRRYQPQYGNELGEWFNLGPSIVATNLHISLADHPDGARSRRVYRAIVLP